MDVLVVLYGARLGGTAGLGGEVGEGVMGGPGIRTGVNSVPLMHLYYEAECVPPFSGLHTICNNRSLS